MKTLRNIALAALLLFVVVPCTYQQHFGDSKDDKLFRAASLAANAPLSDAVIVQGIRERAVCAKMDGKAVVYREVSKTLMIDDGRPTMAAALDGWCRDELGADWKGRALP